MKLAVITYILHKEKTKQFFSYEPYIREMNIWFRYAKEVIITAPKIVAPPHPAEEKYERKDIEFRTVPQLSFVSFCDGLKSISRIPKLVMVLLSTMKDADHIHLRCPGNVSLIACFLQILFPKKPKTTKYAGNWDRSSNQPWTYNLQKWILSNTFLTRNMTVLTYGKWEGQSGNIVPFFTASFSEKLVPKINKKIFHSPFYFLFVGNLVNGKQPLLALSMLEKLDSHQIPVYMDVFGDGPERKPLEIYCRKNDLEEKVVFHGNRPLEELKNAYKKAHFVVLPSRSEGWPKAIAEGMFFGCIPIATPVSCIPWMLGQGARGVLIKDEDKEDITLETFQEIRDLLRDSNKMTTMSTAAKEWSQQYTIERFDAAIQKILKHKNIVDFEPKPPV